jgi:hypothetical protein
VEQSLKDKLVRTGRAAWVSRASEALDCSPQVELGYRSFVDELTAMSPLRHHALGGHQLEPEGPLAHARLIMTFTRACAERRPSRDRSPSVRPAAHGVHG